LHAPPPPPVELVDELLLVELVDELLLVEPPLELLPLPPPAQVTGAHRAGTTAGVQSGWLVWAWTHWYVAPP
jgi:hypothetical protein